jgi:hypothetical protein
MKGIMKDNITWIATWNLHDQDSTEVVCAKGTRKDAINTLIEYVSEHYSTEELQFIIDEFADTTNEVSIEEAYTTFTLTKIEF